ncbi:hypothetical protein C7460_104190 [Marinoscillum furvescens DSM 4134]|uniref:Uncharacterized protein n=2 Tax=Marinoscillum furvescens TaxID=1026 RepID=A0A3D9L795_MARFU|nr:hypothetical protein C7460_104190 [Marinoscillum furvescens DSM 4134]
MSDAILLAHVGKVVQQIPEDLETLEEMIPVINSQFVTHLSEDYLTALREGGDDVASGELGQHTQNLLEAIDDTKRQVKKLRFWINEAFANDPARARSFQLHRFWKVANSQPELIRFMNALATQVQANKPELMAAGAQEALLDSTSIIAERLAEADAIQESSKGGRVQATQARIIALNSLYDRCVKLSRAAQIVFEDSPAGARFYQLPQYEPDATDVEEEAALETH